MSTNSSWNGPVPKISQSYHHKYSFGSGEISNVIHVDMGNWVEEIISIVNKYHYAHFPSRRLNRLNFYLH